MSSSVNNPNFVWRRFVRFMIWNIFGFYICSSESPSFQKDVSYILLYMAILYISTGPNFRYQNLINWLKLAPRVGKIGLTTDWYFIVCVFLTINDVSSHDHVLQNAFLQTLYLLSIKRGRQSQERLIVANWDIIEWKAARGSDNLRVIGCQNCR